MIYLLTIPLAYVLKYFIGLLAKCWMAKGADPYEL